MREGFVYRCARVFTGAVFAASLTALLPPSEARAALLASDTTSDPAYSGGWSSGSNGGFGFGAWQLVSGSTSGFFIGDSTNNGGGGSGNPGSSGGINTTGAVSWGEYAYNGGEADAYRPLTGTLSNGQVLKLALDNGYVGDGGGSGTVGISLLAGGSAGTKEFELYYSSGTYNINDASSSSRSTGISYTDSGLNLAFTLTSPSTYSLNITPANGGSTTTITGTLIGSPTTDNIDTLRAYDYNSGNGTAGNFYINSLSVPEPTSAALIIAASSLLLVRNKRPADLVAIG